MIAPEDPHPDLEDLAAFAEASLDSAERVVVERHLARCDRCLEVVSETLHCLEDHQASSRTGGHSSLSSLRPQTTLLVISAAAGLLLAVGLYLARARVPPYDLEAVTARLDPGMRLDDALRGWESPGWSVFRGPGSPTRAGGASFRAGAHSVSIAVAIEQRDADAARKSAARILDLGDPSSIELLVVKEEALRVSEALAHDPPRWVPAEQTSQRLLRHQLAPELDRFRVLGQWAQTARFASLLEDHDYFRSRHWRTGLRRLSTIKLYGEAAEARQRLDELPAEHHSQRVALLEPLFRALGG